MKLSFYTGKSDKGPNPVISKTMNGIESDLRLDEKVLIYIKSHDDGTNISDLEKVFGETRVRLGYIINKLLEDNKIIKSQNIYFPNTPMENS